MPVGYRCIIHTGWSRNVGSVDVAISLYCISTRCLPGSFLHVGVIAGVLTSVEVIDQLLTCQIDLGRL